MRPGKYTVIVTDKQQQIWKRENTSGQSCKRCSSDTMKKFMWWEIPERQNYLFCINPNCKHVEFI